MLEDTEKEIMKKLDIGNQKKTNIEQNNGDNDKNGDVNPFDFNDTDQQDDEINLNEFLDLAESNRT